MTVVILFANESPVLAVGEVVALQCDCAGSVGKSFLLRFEQL
jgi:hypothetical protein